MEITDEHEARAEALVARDHIMGPTAFRGYLAAVERIGRNGDAGYEEQDHRSWVGLRGPLVLQGIEDLSQDPGQARALMTPDEAEARAYELLVLAGEARAAAEGSGGTER